MLIKPVFHDSSVLNTIVATKSNSRLSPLFKQKKQQIPHYASKKFSTNPVTRLAKHYAHIDHNISNESIGEQAKNWQSKENDNALK